MTMDVSDFYGDAFYSTATSGVLNPRHAKMYTLAPATAATWTIVDARTLDEGFPHLVIRNEGAGTVTVNDNAATGLVSILTGETANLSLFSNATQGGTWVGKVRTSDTVRTGSGI